VDRQRGGVALALIIDRRSVVARDALWILISGSGYDRPPGWRAGWREFHESLDVVKFRWRELATPLVIGAEASVTKVAWRRGSAS
jgi:hypothetical protein